MLWSTWERILPKTWSQERLPKGGLSIWRLKGGSVLARDQAGHVHFPRRGTNVCLDLEVTDTSYFYVNDIHHL